MLRGSATSYNIPNPPSVVEAMKLYPICLLGGVVVAAAAVAAVTEMAVDGDEMQNDAHSGRRVVDEEEARKRLRPHRISSPTAPIALSDVVVAAAKQPKEPKPTPKQPKESRKKNKRSKAATGSPTRSPIVPIPPAPTASPSRSPSRSPMPPTNPPTVSQSVIRSLLLSCPRIGPAFYVTIKSTFQVTYASHKSANWQSFAFLLLVRCCAFNLTFCASMFTILQITVHSLRPLHLRANHPPGRRCLQPAHRL